MEQHLFTGYSGVGIAVLGAFVPTKVVGTAAILKSLNVPFFCYL